jgi:hypothetical protein
VQISEDFTDLISSQPLLSRLIEICQNTLNPDVLDRCLQLLTALISNRPQLLQPLFCTGLAAAIADVLLAAAPVAPVAAAVAGDEPQQVQEEQKGQPQGTAERSAWSDDDDDEGGGELGR